MSRRLLPLALLLVLPSCRHAPAPAPQHSDAMAAATLARLAEDYWDHEMRKSPVWATFLSDRRFDDVLPDLTPPGIARARERARFLHREARRLEVRRLAAQDRLTRDILLAMLDAELGAEVCELHLWNVNALDGVQTLLGELPSLHGLSEEAHAQSLLTRYRKSGDFIDQHISNLRTGRQRGYRAAKVAVERVVVQLDGMLAEPVERSPWVAEVRLPEDWKAERRAELAGELLAAAQEVVLPALERYRQFLRNEYLPEARAEVGVHHNPGGARCYRARIKAQTGLDLSPDDIHRMGVEEAERNVAEMKVLAQRLAGTPELAAVDERLRADPARTAATREDLLAFTTALVERAQARMPEVFGRLPAQEVKVKPIEAFREASAPGGYYYSGSRAEGRPAYFYLNTSAPQTRLFHALESLTFHETVPGHHLQSALAQELDGLPRFRRELGDSAFTEGWAHYAELLADELGLYTDDAGRFGMLSDQSLRAVRLVTDTGMHHKGWSREQALAYMLAHTAEPRDQAEREIDRYIVWPGQALAYKVGQLEILRLRREAKEKLGERFDLGAFHDVVLRNGALPLPLLRAEVEAWIARRSAAET